MSIATNLIPAFHCSSRGASQSITGCAARPLTCTNNPPAPVMSTSPVSQRSTHRRTPVSGQVSHLAFPRRVSSMPSTTTSSGSAARTGSAVSFTAPWQMFQVVPYAAATALTERSSSRTANAISAFARTVTRARGGTAGTDSVKRFRLQNILVHNHFRFRHTIRGRSGPILISRGRVLTHPFDRDDRPRHSGHTPTQSRPVKTWTVRIRSSSICTESTTTPSSPSSSEPLSLGMLAPLLLDA
jgi:hypothetical protein